MKQFNYSEFLHNYSHTILVNDLGFRPTTEFLYTRDGQGVFKGDQLPSDLINFVYAARRCKFILDFLKNGPNDLYSILARGSWRELNKSDEWPRKSSRGVQRPLNMNDAFMRFLEGDGDIADLDFEVEDVADTVLPEAYIKAFLPREIKKLEDKVFYIGLAEIYQGTEDPYLYAPFLAGEETYRGTVHIVQKILEVLQLAGIDDRDDFVGKLKVVTSVNMAVDAVFADTISNDFNLYTQMVKTDKKVSARREALLPYYKVSSGDERRDVGDSVPGFYYACAAVVLSNEQDMVRYTHMLGHNSVPDRYNLSLCRLLVNVVKLKYRSGDKKEEARFNALLESLFKTADDVRDIILKGLSLKDFRDLVSLNEAVDLVDYNGSYKFQPKDAYYSPRDSRMFIGRVGSHRVSNVISLNSVLTPYKDIKDTSFFTAFSVAGDRPEEWLFTREFLMTLAIDAGLGEDEWEGVLIELTKKWGPEIDPEYREAYTNLPGSGVVIREADMPGISAMYSLAETSNAMLSAAKSLMAVELGTRVMSITKGMEVHTLYYKRDSNEFVTVPKTSNEFKTFLSFWAKVQDVYMGYRTGGNVIVEDLLKVVKAIESSGSSKPELEKFVTAMYAGENIPPHHATITAFVETISRVDKETRRLVEIKLLDKDASFTATQTWLPLVNPMPSYEEWRNSQKGYYNFNNLSWEYYDAVNYNYIQKGIQSQRNKFTFDSEAILAKVEREVAQEKLEEEKEMDDDVTDEDLKDYTDLGNIPASKRRSIFKYIAVFIDGRPVALDTLAFRREDKFNVYLSPDDMPKQSLFLSLMAKDEFKYALEHAQIDDVAFLLTEMLLIKNTLYPNTVCDDSRALILFEWEETRFYKTWCNTMWKKGVSSTVPDLNVVYNKHERRRVLDLGDVVVAHDLDDLRKVKAISFVKSKEGAKTLVSFLSMINTDFYTRALPDKRVVILREGLENDENIVVNRCMNAAVVNTLHKDQYADIFKDYPKDTVMGMIETVMGDVNFRQSREVGEYLADVYDVKRVLGVDNSFNDNKLLDYLVSARPVMSTNDVLFYVADDREIEKIKSL